MARNPAPPDFSGRVRRIEEEIRQLRLRRLDGTKASDFTPLVPNEGFDATDLDCGYYLTPDGFVVFTGGLYWGFPSGYVSTGYGDEAPENDAVNLFTGPSSDAFGGSAFGSNLLPSEVRPVYGDQYAFCGSIEGDHGVSGSVRYETRVSTAGAWNVSRAFTGGTAMPVDSHGYTHGFGVPYNTFIMLEGVSWRVRD